MNKLIAFVGFKSSGKNTAAIPLVEQFGYHALSFADAMKDALASIFCWPRDLLEGVTLESRLWRETIDPWWAAKLGIADFTPRWAMRNFGTEVMRNHFHPQVWVLNVERRIMLLSDTPVVLIDARFPNEIALAREFGGVVARIKRGPEPEWYDSARLANAGSGQHRKMMIEDFAIHESEWAWLSSPVDRTFTNDDDIAALHREVIAWASGGLAG